MRSMNQRRVGVWHSFAAKLALRALSSTLFLPKLLPTINKAYWWQLGFFCEFRTFLTSYAFFLQKTQFFVILT